MGGEPAGEKAGEKTGEDGRKKRRRAPGGAGSAAACDFIWKRKASRKKTGPDKAGFHLAGDLAEEFSRPERKPKWVCPVCEAENSVKSFRCEVLRGRKTLN